MVLMIEDLMDRSSSSKVRQIDLDDCIATQRTPHSVHHWFKGVDHENCVGVVYRPALLRIRAPGKCRGLSIRLSMGASRILRKGGVTNRTLQHLVGWGCYQLPRGLGRGAWELRPTKLDRGDARGMAAFRQFASDRLYAALIPLASGRGPRRRRRHGPCPVQDHPGRGMLLSSVTRQADAASTYRVFAGCRFGFSPDARPAGAGCCGCAGCCSVDAGRSRSAKATRIASMCFCISVSARS